ncbi:DUF917 domain-containing protein [Arthrobacter sp. efr-133-R2A-120]|uniref:DUF917 domain-containing protein n=1 Tax=Arthrobacter sp. efr-133-R2A-120 TaxID=3040277 RepID=UPI0025513C6F|nr:DUF917 domain-containing protein [Arthrobacter sp. efr-133-R2A-120]
MPWVLKSSGLEALEFGARMQGSGGAGDTHAISLLTRNVLEQRGGVTVFPPSKIAPNDVVIPVGLAGSPLAFSEKPGGPDPYTRAFEAVAAKFPGTRPLVCAFEMAGINAYAPILVAAALDIPMIDLDGMGRGLSGLHQTTFNAHSVPMTPCALVDASGRCVEICGTGAEDAERSLRLLMGIFGGWVAFAGYAMDGVQARQAGITGTLRRAIELGYQFQQSRKLTASVSDAIMHFSQHTKGCLHVGRGSVVDVKWEPAPRGSDVGVHAKGTIIVRAQGRYLRIEAQNEFLLLIDEGRLLAKAPQIICLLDSHTGTPLLSERTVPGYGVDILVFEAPGKWTEASARSLVDIAGYGYTIPSYGAPQ